MLMYMYMYMYMDVCIHTYMCIYPSMCRLPFCGVGSRGSRAYKASALAPNFSERKSLTT